jgi:hypothetical protein
MIRAIGWVFLAVSAGTASGCLTPQAYVDPHYRKASYESIGRLAQPVPVRVDVQFLRNGQPLPAADNELRMPVERTLRASGVFVPATAGIQAAIKVTGNNIADVEAARAKGFRTGLTFGGAGSMVDDNYEFLCVYQKDGEDKQYSYQHALHTAIGSTERPAGLTPTTPAEGFARVVEDVMLNFIKDLQDSGAAPKQ